MPADLTSFLEIIPFLNWNAFLFLIITLGLLLLGKSAYPLLVRYHLDEELTLRDNKAVAISFSGFILSIGLVLEAALDVPTHSGYLVEDSIKLLVWGTVSGLFLLLSRIVNDRLILPKLCLKEELKERKNMGVGIVQAGDYIATALIIRGAILGEEVIGLGAEVLVATLWFILSQALLLAYATAYKIISPFHLHRELERGNAAAGVSFSGSLISFSILISFYLMNFKSIIGLLLWGILAIFLLRFITLIVDKIFLPSQAFKKEVERDQNWGAALIDAVTSIIAALILSGSLF